MSLPPYLASYFSGAQTWLNANADFTSYPVTPGFPTGWSNWAGPTPTRASGGGMDLAAVAGADAGVQQFSGLLPVARPGWYVLEATASLVSGSLLGAGMQVNLYADTAYQSFTEDVQLVLAVDPDVNGVVQSGGATGSTYTWRKLVRINSTSSTAFIVYAMAHYSGLGSTAAANEIVFKLAGFRAASPAEIAAGNQVQGLPVFPLLPGVSPDVEKAPSWSTKVLRASAGNERRTALWPYPIWNFALKHEVLRNDAVRGAALLDEVKGVWELFNTVQGQFGTFLFLDETACQVQAEQIGVGDGVTTSFQLVRHVRNWFEPVLAPFAVDVLVGGAPVGFSLGAGGLVTLASPPASGAAVAWSGDYFFPCRFTQDDLTLRRIAHQLWSNEGLKFSSVRSIT